MELYLGVKTYYAKSRRAWRQWLTRNHQKEDSVWLIIYKKDSGTPSVYYSEAVDEALSFGWIDSKPNKRDADSYYQFFTRRNPKSKWSVLNKNKVATLIKEGLMQPAGLAMVELAKKTGTWEALDTVYDMILPQELELAFKRNKQAFDYWQAFPKSTKRGILEWIQNAKQPETKAKRIEETVSKAAQNIRANQYSRKETKK
jgi:uncharacterized protein YdeI (YjbR/CyaY-like superfamily)